MELIDLHIHSTYSDGSLPPAALVTLAKDVGLEAIALTDHDTMAGTAEALELGLLQGIEVIAGIEISSWHQSTPMHILGYGLRYDDPLLALRLEKLQEGREVRNAKIIDNLNRLGIEVSLDELRVYSAYGQTGRPHIAELLVGKGVVASREKAFDRYLKRGAVAYEERFRYEATDAITMIREAGGVAVLAHPASLDPSLQKIPGLLRDLAEVGLEGIEVHYPTHSRKIITLLQGFAEKIGLLSTGGSDFHGNGADLRTIEKKLLVPYHLLSSLKKRLASH